MAASTPQYPNPRFEIDPLTDRVILQYRDTQNGAPIYQVPSSAQLRLYQGTQAQASAVAAPTVTGATAA